MNQRSTKQKKFIHDYLLNAYNHPTAYDVCNAAKEIGIKLGLTTCYRILNNMVENNEAISIITKDNVIHYDILREDHYHFVCNHCHKIIDEKDNLLFFDQCKNQFNENKVTIQSLTIYGLCNECKNKI